MSSAPLGGLGRRRRSLLRAALPLSALAALGSPRPLAAQASPPTRPASLVVDDRQTLRMTLSYRDIVDGATSAKLTGGLPTTIVMRAYVLREGGGPWLAATYKQCRVIFDLWDEVYRIEISQAGLPKSDQAAASLEGVLRRCAEADRIAVAPRAVLPSPENYFIAVMIEVNPISPDMLDRINRWVSRPVPPSAAAPGDSLFGSFVGLFAARLGRADREISFRTPTFSL